jgi:hypothetical protein
MPPQEIKENVPVTRRAFCRNMLSGRKLKHKWSMLNWDRALKISGLEFYLDSREPRPVCFVSAELARPEEQMRLFQ